MKLEFKFEINSERHTYAYSRITQHIRLVRSRIVLTKSGAKLLQPGFRTVDCCGANEL
jgi:hypothetical protein